MHAHARPRTSPRLCLAFFVAILAMVLVVPAASAAPKTKLMSQSSSWEQSTESSVSAGISGDGNRIVFHTTGSLVDSDSNGKVDVYRRYVTSGKTKLVSRAHDGGPGNRDSNMPSISVNGRFVTFSSMATDLRPTPLVAGFQIYRRNLDTGEIKHVSRNGSTFAGGDCLGPDISATGRYVVFHSAVTNLVSKDTYGHRQVYLRDLKTGRLELISRAAGLAGNNESSAAVVSRDGRFVAFQSIATNLSSKDERHRVQIFLRDRKLNKTFLVSQNRAKGKAGDGNSLSPAISNDGRTIVFGSEARNLIKWGVDSNGVEDIYRYDHRTRSLSRVSLGPKGRQLDGKSRYPDISADGRVIAFDSEATNAIKGGTDGEWHVYRRALPAGRPRLVSRNKDGEPGNSYSLFPEISGDGRHVVFVSAATNLTKGPDANGSRLDIFRRGPF